MQQPPPTLFPFPPQPRKRLYQALLGPRLGSFELDLFSISMRSPHPSSRPSDPFLPILPRESTPDARNRLFASTAEAKILPRGVKRACKTITNVMKCNKYARSFQQTKLNKPYRKDERSSVVILTESNLVINLKR